MTLLPKQEWTTFVYYVFEIESPYERNLPSHFSQKAISVYIFISNIRFMIYSYWVHSFIRLLRKPLLHFCTLGIIYHMMLQKKKGDILCALIIRIALDQISHTWFDWNLEMAALFLRKTPWINSRLQQFFIACVQNTLLPEKNSKNHSLKPVG